VLLCWGNTLLAVPQAQLSFRRRLQQALFFGMLFALVTLALNPVLWSNPWRSALAAWQERNSLVQEQVAAIRQVNPELVWESYPQRVLGTIAHLYFTKPATADLKNYLAQTQAAEQAYFNNPIHSLFRSLWGGTLWLFLSLFGLAMAALQARRQALPQPRLVWLLILATALQVVGQVVFIPIPFQRYVLPLIPFQCLWSAKGIEGFIQMMGYLLRKTIRPISEPKIPD
ncbi:MAG: hypothetical protein ACK44E_08055, partial [Anaerolineales bacterium]